MTINARLSSYAESEDNASLKRAAEYYEKVLSVYPDNDASQNNLIVIYELLNEPVAALKVLENSSSLKSDQYYSSIGDYYLSQQKWDSARYAFEKSVEQNNYNENSYRGLLKVARTGALSEREIYTSCFQMVENGYDELARRTMADLINRELEQKKPFNEKAFVWWVQLVSRVQNIEGYLKRHSNNNWRHESIDEIRTILSGKISRSRELPWWSQNTKYSFIDGKPYKTRNEIIAALMLGAGKEAKKRGDIKTALSLVEISLEILTRGSLRSYVSSPGSISNTFFSIVQELGFLYTQHEKISDPGGRKFSRLERDLFAGKGNAYLGSDNPSIVKFHTALGLIYAEKGQWRGGRFENAIFQLRNAISKSPESANTGYLNMLLSEGYMKVGNRPRSQDALTKAAKSYLNHDDLVSANLAFQTYEASNFEPTAEHKSVMQVYEFRKSLPNLKQNDISRDLGNQLEGILNNAQVGDYFNIVQKFKIFNDLGNLAQDYGMNRVADQYYLKSFELTKDMKGVSGSDVKRLDNQIKLIDRKPEIKQQNLQKQRDLIKLKGRSIK